MGKAVGSTAREAGFKAHFLRHFPSPVTADDLTPTPGAAHAHSAVSEDGHPPQDLRAKPACVKFSAPGTLSWWLFPVFWLPPATRGEAPRQPR